MRDICTDLIDLLAKSNPELVRDVLRCNSEKPHEMYNLNRMKILSDATSFSEDSMKAESLVEASLNADNATRMDRNATKEERRVVFVTKLLAAKLLAVEMERETDPDNLEELVEMSVQLCPLMIETYVPYQKYLPRVLIRVLYQCRDENDFVLRDVMSRAVSRARKLIWTSRRQRAAIAFQFGSRVLGWQIPYFCLSVILSLSCGLCAASHLRYHSSIASLARKVFDTRGGTRGGHFLSQASDLVIAMVLMKVTELTLQLIRNRVNESSQSRLLLRLKRELFAAVLRQDITWFDNKSVGGGSGTYFCPPIQCKSQETYKKKYRYITTCSRSKTTYRHGRHDRTSTSQRTYQYDRVPGKSTVFDVDSLSHVTKNVASSLCRTSRKDMSGSFSGTHRECCGADCDCT